MKLGTIKNQSLKKYGIIPRVKTPLLDGHLVVVSRDNKRAYFCEHIIPTLRDALENWDDVSGPLEKIYQELNLGTCSGAFEISQSDLMSSLPRTFLFADGSAFIQHVKLVRMARKAEMPVTLKTVPLMYQAECARFLNPDENIVQLDFAHGTDFEAEVGVITDFVPMGTSPAECLKKIRLIVLINDVSLRGLIPEELAAGFGFFQSKPSSALSPFAVTPDELGHFWKEGRVHLPLVVDYNESAFGRANAGEMHFHFGDLIAHAAKTRDLQPGTIIGSGTVANEDQSKGSSCLAEKRMLEQINEGKMSTPFMKDGDTVSIEMFNDKGESIFGRIFQRVQKA